MFGIDNDALDRFLVPEKELSLKLYFDNLRNYAIVGVMFALSHWLLDGATLGAARRFHRYVSLDFNVLSWAALALGGILFMANALQTNVLLVRSIAFAWSRGMPTVGQIGRATPWHGYVLRAIVWTTVALFYSSLVAMAGAVIPYVIFFAQAGGKN